MADKLLKSIKFPTLPDRYVIGDTTLTEEGAAAEAKAVGEALATKADTKGRYEDLIVGGAEQLMSDEYESDTDPYLFRHTGGSADVGNREYLDSIVGGTVAWNQLEELPTSVTWKFDTASGTITNGVTEFTPSARYGRFETQSDDARPSTTTGHKYIALASVKLTTATNLVLFQIRDYAEMATKAQAATASVTSEQTLGTIYNETATGKIKPRIIDTRTSGWDKITVSNIMLIDLTAMFGSTIADYIYSLEQANAGAGVAWFRNYFPKDYYPYDPGTLRSVEGVSAHETVGFNQWDEEWEAGYIDSTTGQNREPATCIRSKNYIPIFPNTNYYLNVPARASIFFYDADKNYLSVIYRNAITITTPQNCAYMRFVMADAYGTTYKNDICINLSWSGWRNGDYEPYEKHSYPLDSDLTLRGIPKLDANNNLYYDGDIYAPSGEVTRKYGIVDLGTLNWSFNGDPIEGVHQYAAQVSGKAVGMFNMRCSKMTCENLPTGALNNIVGREATTTVSVNSTLATAADFKTAMSGVYLVYELATPTTETAEGYEHYQICDPSGTEEFVTTGIVQVGHETRYPHDLKKKIETAPDSPSTDGTYLMKRSGGKNTYMALPSTPSANGAYVLTVTVSGGTASYSWTAKE